MWNNKVRIHWFLLNVLAVQMKYWRSCGMMSNWPRPNHTDSGNYWMIRNQLYICTGQKDLENIFEFRIRKFLLYLHYIKDIFLISSLLRVGVLLNPSRKKQLKGRIWNILKYEGKLVMSRLAGRENHPLKLTKTLNPKGEVTPSFLNIHVESYH